MSVNTVISAIDHLEEQLDTFPDWEERYAYIISLGKTLAPYPEEQRNDDFIVKGCQSKVWLHPTFDGNLIHFNVDSDAIIVKGLAALLMQIYNDRTPDEVLSVQRDFVARLGLDTALSQNRANGLASMMKQILMYAMAYKVKSTT